MYKVLLFFLFISCSTISAPVVIAPIPPDAPAIKSYKKLDDKDRDALIKFYQDYRKFLLKYKEWKKEFK